MLLLYVSGESIAYICKSSAMSQALRGADAHVMPSGYLCDVQEAVEEVLGHTEEVYRG